MFLGAQVFNRDVAKKPPRERERTVTTKTEAAKMTAIKIEVLKILNSVDQLVDRFDTNQLEDLCKFMHQINDQWNTRKTTFDAKLKVQVEAGNVSVSETIKPLRAWRKEDAAKPGRKVVVKTAAEKMAESMGLSVDDLPAELVAQLNNAG